MNSRVVIRRVLAASFLSSQLYMALNCPRYKILSVSLLLQYYRPLTTWIDFATLEVPRTHTSLDSSLSFTVDATTYYSNDHDLDLSSLTLKSLSAMPTHTMNICS